MNATTRSVLIAGATGLTGHELLAFLLEDPSVAHVLAPTRHALPAHPKLENPVGMIGHLIAQLHGHLDTVYCCLGTTIRQAGSREAFRMVDYDLPLSLGRHALALGARHYVVISALGADAGSRLFYNRTKGELELALQKQGWPQLTIVRPSLLLGARNKPRMGEVFAAPFSRVLPGRWRGIEAGTVARAMWRLGSGASECTRIVESDELQQIGS
ncbi:oxidoreductase [Dyella solisilvae]|uniref:Oxidoreductase n=1 Tax=Dyella solisilvae TaxID=1920168 RepID=A0A370KBP1_9GAMM|nr:oxidoreductase [Dyella solisilvae]RDJ00073.1 oxidoreductase [Dyella solisilvae]